MGGVELWKGWNLVRGHWEREDGTLGGGALEEGRWNIEDGTLGGEALGRGALVGVEH